MILVTLGTQDKEFRRLLDIVEDAIDRKVIKDEVIVQAGHTKYESKNMKIFDFSDREEFGKLINECDLLITHAGVGSIITGLNNNKKVIVVPRLAKYNEHLNDHQLQITNNFVKKGYILALQEEDKIDDVLNKIKKFKPNKFESNTKNMVKLIESFIDNN